MAKFGPQQIVHVGPLRDYVKQVLQNKSCIKKNLQNKSCILGFHMTSQK